MHAEGYMKQVAHWRPLAIHGPAMITSYIRMVGHTDTRIRALIRNCMGDGPCAYGQTICMHIATCRQPLRVYMHEQIITCIGWNSYNAFLRNCPIVSS